MPAGARRHRPDPAAWLRRRAALRSHDHVDTGRRRAPSLRHGEAMKRPPHVVAIDHVQLAMPAGGEDRARAFYAGILGLAEVPKPPPLAPRGGCWFESDTVKVHLGVEPDFQPATKAHPAFVVA